jgi:uncharacterized membrane protein YqaE (UPF0057 family)
MMYLLAIFFPPIAVLFTGKPFQAFINLLLCLCLWIPAVIHAFAIVNEKKMKKLIRQH